MRHLLALCAFLLTLASSLLATQPAASAALAADPFVGTYLLTKTDDTPIEPGVVIELAVSDSFFPCYLGVVTVDSGDGPVVVEIMLICPQGEGFVTHNSNDSRGKITPKDPGEFETEMTSGPNKGVKRKMKKLP